jgi:hypothetical protein
MEVPVDAAKLSNEQIRAELARQCEGPGWLLESRRWRLEFELRYRERANGQSRSE